MKKYRYSMAFLSLLFAVSVLFMPRYLESPARSYAEENDLSYIVTLHGIYSTGNEAYDIDIPITYNVEFFSQDGILVDVSDVFLLDIYIDTFNILYSWGMLLLIPLLFGVFGLFNFIIKKNKTYPNIIIMSASVFGIAGLGTRFIILTSILFFIAAISYIMIKITIYSYDEMIENYRKSQSNIAP